MKRLLTGLVLTGLVWHWSLSPAAAEPPAPKSPDAAATLFQPTWPADAPCIAELDANCDNLGDRDPFTKGQCSFQFMAGYFPKTDFGPGGPLFDYVPIGCRVGVMACTPQDGWGCLRGNVEILLEVYGAPVVREFGNYVVGPDIIFRYNFVQPDWLFIPYIQAGAGFAFTDGWKWPAPYQELIGQELEFLLRVEVGTRFMMTECLSFDAEFGLQHISNATLAPRNGGINNIGFSVGFTYFFGKGR